MPRFLLCSLVALGVVLTGCGRRDPQVEFRWRFLGGQVLKAQTNAPALRDILLLPEAGPLAGPLARQLAGVWWSSGTADRELPEAAARDGASLTADLLNHLSVGEIVRTPGGAREFALALQLPAERAEAWERAWPAWIEAVHSAREGKAGAPSVVRRDPWVLAVSDATLLPPDTTFRRLAEYPPIAGALLQFEAHVPDFPAIRGAFVPTNGNVRLTATVRTSKSLPPLFPAWQLPTALREPIVQFSAIRGLNDWGQGWLNPTPWTGGAWPSEVFVWSQQGLALRTYLAARTDHPEQIVQHWFKRLESSFAPFSPAPLYLGRLIQETNPPRLIVTGGLPVAPVWQAYEDDGRKFLTFGLVPMAQATNPPAPEMLARLNRPTVLLYDWEFTSEAIKHWHALDQLPALFEGRQGILTDPGSRWLLAAAAKLGESVTEAEVAGEHEVSIQRKAPAGLTGLELTLLAKWLDPVPPMRLRPTNSSPAAVRK
ncbi:MAG TPA: hypothetical protein PLX89_24275 [Verrucomicrobiota bacterium]|nr:hypothetical protein [Verrucomicrobiota bacterium]